MVKAVTSGSTTAHHEFNAHPVRSRVASVKVHDSYQSPPSPGFSFVHGMGMSQSLVQTQQAELRFMQYLSFGDILAEFAEIYRKAEKIIYQKHGLEFTYALVSKTEMPYLAHIGSMGLYAGNGMLFVVHDMMPHLKPEEKARVIDYVAVHEYGESVFGDHHEASLLEFAIAQKEGHLDAYLQVLKKNYFLKFRDVAVNRMQPQFDEGLSNAGIHIPDDFNSIEVATDHSDSAARARKFRDGFAWQETHRQYLDDIGSYRDEEVQKTQDWLRVIIVNEEVRHHFEDAINRTHAVLDGDGPHKETEALKTFYASFASLSSLFSNHVYDKKRVVADSLNQIFGNDLINLFSQVLLSDNPLALKSSNSVKSVLDTVEKIHKISELYLKTVDDVHQEFMENPQVIQKAFDLAILKLSGNKMTIQVAKKEMDELVRQVELLAIPGKIETYVADEFENNGRIHRLLDDKNLSNLPPELYEKVFLYNFEELLYSVIIAGEKKVDWHYLDNNPEIAQKIFQRVLDGVLIQSKKYLIDNTKTSHPLMSMTHIPFEISKMQERYGTFGKPKNDIKHIWFLLDDLAVYLDLHADPSLEEVVQKMVLKYLGDESDLKYFIHETRFSQDFKKKCLQSFVGAMETGDSIHPFLMEMILSELGIESEKDVLETVAQFYFGTYMQEPMLAEAIRVHPVPLVSEGKLSPKLKAFPDLRIQSELERTMSDNTWVPVWVSESSGTELAKKIIKFSHDIRLGHLIENKPEELKYLDPQSHRESRGLLAFFVLNRLLFLTYKLEATARRINERDVDHFKKIEETLLTSFNGRERGLTDKNNLVNWDDAVCWCRENSKSLSQYLSSLISEVFRQGSLAPMSDYYFSTSFNDKTGFEPTIQNAADILGETTETDKQSTIYDEMVNATYSLSQNKKRTLYADALEGHADYDSELLKHYLSFMEYYKTSDMNPLVLLQRYSRMLEEIKPIVGVLIQSTDDAKLLLHGLIRLSLKDQYHYFQDVNPWHAESLRMTEGIRDLVVAIPQTFVPGLLIKSQKGIRYVDGGDVTAEWGLKSYYDFFVSKAVAYRKKYNPHDVMTHFEREGIKGVTNTDFDVFFTGAPLNAHQAKSFLFNFLVNKSENERVQYILGQCFDSITQMTNADTLRAGLKILTASLGTLGNFQPQATYSALGKYTLNGIFTLFGLSHDSNAGYDSFQTFTQNLLGEIPGLDQMHKSGFMQGLLKMAQKQMNKKSGKALELSFVEYQQMRKDAGTRQVVPSEDIMPLEGIVTNNEEIVAADVSDNGSDTDTAFVNTDAADRVATSMATGIVSPLAGTPILPVR